MRIQFNKCTTNQQLHPVTTNDKQAELIFESKVSGLTIRSDLKWNSHIDKVVKKASKRMNFLRQLKRSKVPISEIICFYCTCIRSVVEYASPVFHYTIPNYLCKHIEQIQRRAMRIIFPTKSYAEALRHSKLLTLEERRQKMCDKLQRNYRRPKPWITPTITGTKHGCSVFAKDFENF